MYHIIRYIVCNKQYKAFLEGQISKDKTTTLLSIKKPTLLMWQLIIFLSFFHIFIFFCTAFVLYKHNYKSLLQLQVFHILCSYFLLTDQWWIILYWYKWYLTIFSFFMLKFPSHFINWYIKHKEALINIDNSKKSMKLSTKHKF